MYPRLFSGQEVRSVGVRIRFQGYVLYGQKCEGFLSRLLGLIGVTPKTAQGRCLVFERCRSVHTVGMKDALDVAFIDSAGRCVRSCRQVKPRRFLKAGRANLVLERFSSCEAWPRYGESVEICEVKR